MFIHYLCVIDIILGQSCNKLGQYSCLRCKICYCEDHIRRKGFKYEKNKAIPCPKCGYETSQTKDLSMSSKNNTALLLIYFNFFLSSLARSHKFGRQSQAAYNDEDDYSSDYTGMNRDYLQESYDETYSDEDDDDYEETDDEEDTEESSGEQEKNDKQ